MAVKARMKVTTINAQPTYVAVSLSAVYSSDPTDPNYSFSQATPSAALTMTITNQAAFDQFGEGDVFDVDFTKVFAGDTPPAPAEPTPAPTPAPAVAAEPVQETSA